MRYKTKGVNREAIMVSEKANMLHIPTYLAASQPCNNPLCVNVDHLIFEPQALNNNNNISICFSNSTCYGHWADLDGQPCPLCLIDLLDATSSYLGPL